MVVLRNLVLVVALLVATDAAAQQCGVVQSCPSASTPLAGTELLFCEQSGQMKKCTAQQIANAAGVVPPFTAGDVAGIEVGGTIVDTATLSQATIPTSVRISNGGLTLTGGSINGPSEYSLAYRTTMTNTSSAVTVMFGSTMSNIFSPQLNVANLHGYQANFTIANSSKNLSNVDVFFAANLTLDPTYTGTIGSINVFEANTFNPANPTVSHFESFLADSQSNGNGVTTGVVRNADFNALGFTGSAGLGGTINNDSILAVVSTGSGAGTNTNVGIHIVGNGGSGGSGTTNNWALKIDSTAPNQVAGNLTVLGVLGSNPATWTDTQTCTPGQIASDSGFLYVCTATNTVKRVSLSGF